MTLSSNQPYFMPYLPYWRLIDSADLFLIGDDYNFIKHGWIQRNRVLVNGEPSWFRLPVKDLSCHRLICETEISPYYNPTKLLRTLWNSYRKTAAFDSVYPVMEEILTIPERNICDFLEESIRRICAFVGITTPIGRTSTYSNRDSLQKEERIYDYCARTGADTYLNASGGRELYFPEEFAARGLRLEFVDYSFPPYSQSCGSFIPGLSIVDALFNVGAEKTLELIRK